MQALEEEQRASAVLIQSLAEQNAQVVRAMLPKATFATVYAKPAGKPLVDAFVTEVSQDTWIFFPWDMALQYVQPFRGTD